MTTITVPATMEITMPRKAGALTVPVGQMPESIVLRLLAYGVQQKYSDSVSDKEAFGTADAIKAEIESVIASHIAGDWGRSRASGPETPERRARKIVLAKLQAREEFKPGKIAKDEKARAALAEALNKALQDPKWLAVAKAQLDAEASLGDIDL